MTDEEQLFETEILEWHWTANRELGGGRAERPPTRSGPKVIRVRCLGCGEKWVARKRRFPTEGHFTPLPGHVHLWCPKCGRQGTVPNTDL